MKLHNLQQPVHEMRISVRQCLSQNGGTIAKCSDHLPTPKTIIKIIIRLQKQFQNKTAYRKKTRVRFRILSQTPQVFSSQVYENSNSKITPTLFQFTLKSVNLAAVAYYSDVSDCENTQRN